MQTKKSQIRLLLGEQSDQGLFVCISVAFDLLTTGIKSSGHHFENSTLENHAL